MVSHYERFSLQIAGAARQTEGVDDFADELAFCAGHGNELLIELEEEEGVAVGILAREEGHGFAGGHAEAMLEGVVRGARFSFDTTRTGALAGRGWGRSRGCGGRGHRCRRGLFNPVVIF